MDGFVHHVGVFLREAGSPAWQSSADWLQWFQETEDAWSLTLDWLQESSRWQQNPTVGFFVAQVLSTKTWNEWAHCTPSQRQMLLQASYRFFSGCLEREDDSRIPWSVIERSALWMSRTIALGVCSRGADDASADLAGELAAALVHFMTTHEGAACLHAPILALQYIPEEVERIERHIRAQASADSNPANACFPHWSHRSVMMATESLQQLSPSILPPIIAAIQSDDHARVQTGWGCATAWGASPLTNSRGKHALRWDWPLLSESGLWDLALRFVCEGAERDADAAASFVEEVASWSLVTPPLPGGRERGGKEGSDCDSNSAECQLQLLCSTMLAFAEGRDRQELYRRLRRKQVSRVLLAVLETHVEEMVTLSHTNMLAAAWGDERFCGGGSSEWQVRVHSSVWSLIHAHLAHGPREHLPGMLTVLYFAWDATSRAASDGVQCAMEALPHLLSRLVHVVQRSFDRSAQRQRRRCRWSDVQWEDTEQTLEESHGSLRRMDAVQQEEDDNDDDDDTDSDDANDEASASHSSGVGSRMVEARRRAVEAALAASSHWPGPMMWAKMLWQSSIQGEGVDGGDGVGSACMAAVVALLQPAAEMWVHEMFPDNDDDDEEDDGDASAAGDGMRGLAIRSLPGRTSSVGGGKGGFVRASSLAPQEPQANGGITTASMQARPFVTARHYMKRASPRLQLRSRRADASDDALLWLDVVRSLPAWLATPTLGVASRLHALAFLETLLPWIVREPAAVDPSVSALLRGLHALTEQWTSEWSRLLAQLSPVVRLDGCGPEEAWWRVWTCLVGKDSTDVSSPVEEEASTDTMAPSGRGDSSAPDHLPFPPEAARPVWAGVRASVAFGGLRRSARASCDQPSGVARRLPTQAWVRSVTVLAQTVRQVARMSACGANASVLAPVWPALASAIEQLWMGLSRTPWNDKDESHGSILDALASLAGPAVASLAATWVAVAALSCSNTGAGNGEEDCLDLAIRVVGATSLQWIQLDPSRPASVDAVVECGWMVSEGMLEATSVLSPDTWASLGVRPLPHTRLADWWVQRWPLLASAARTWASSWAVVCSFLAVRFESSLFDWKGFLVLVLHSVDIGFYFVCGFMFVCLHELVQVVREALPVGISLWPKEMVQEFVDLVPVIARADCAALGPALPLLDRWIAPLAREDADVAAGVVGATLEILLRAWTRWSVHQLAAVCSSRGEQEMLEEAWQRVPTGTLRAETLGQHARSLWRLLDTLATQLPGVGDVDLVALSHHREAEAEAQAACLSATAWRTWLEAAAEMVGAAFPIGTMAIPGWMPFHTLIADGAPLAGHLSLAIGAVFCNGTGIRGVRDWIALARSAVVAVTRLPKSPATAASSTATVVAMAANAWREECGICHRQHGLHGRGGGLERGFVVLLEELCDVCHGGNAHAGDAEDGGETHVLRAAVHVGLCAGLLVGLHHAGGPPMTGNGARNEVDAWQPQPDSAWRHAAVDMACATQEPMNSQAWKRKLKETVAFVYG